MLTKVMEDTRLLLASMLKLPFSQKLDHGSYTELQCFALQTSDDDCKTNHANECPCGASCMEVSPEHGNPPKGRIIDYIANGLEYVAISHVWAHVLGEQNWQRESGVLAGWNGFGPSKRLWWPKRPQIAADWIPTSTKARLSSMRSPGGAVLVLSYRVCHKARIQRLPTIPGKG